jgi:dipeptidase
MKLAELIDEFGAADKCSVTFGDASETWYMEILSGHAYAAAKAPEDKLGFSPDLSMLAGVDPSDSENVILSPDFIATATTAGTLKLGQNGTVIVAGSYCFDPASLLLRIYQAVYYLKGQLSAANLMQQGSGPYYMESEASVYTSFDAMKLLAYHGDKNDPVNGAYVESPKGNINAISSDCTVSAHLFERRSSLPEEMAILGWAAMGPPEFSIFLPFFGSMVEELDGSYYAHDSETFNLDSMYWVFREIYKLTDKNREYAEDSVSAFLDRYQQALIQQQEVVDIDLLEIYENDPIEAALIATELSKSVSAEALEYAKMLLAELQAFDALLAKDTFTLSPTLEIVLPDYRIKKAIISNGDFEIIADKANKTLTVTGDGYLPGETVTVSVGYDYAPDSQNNDYTTTISATTGGGFSITVPSNITGVAPWLGGDQYYVTVNGLTKSAAIYTTQVKAHTSIRIYVTRGVPFQLISTIDGRLYQYTSANNNVVTVDQNGLLNPIRAGSATITLKATDGSNKSDVVAVTVNL